MAGTPNYSFGSNAISKKENSSHHFIYNIKVLAMPRKYLLETRMKDFDFQTFEHFQAIPER